MVEIGNIVFLDFDGVITTLKSRWKIDREKCKLVKKICDETRAKIVISSSWRKYSFEETMKQFNREEFILYDYIIDITKRLTLNGTNLTVPRGVEIMDWIENHTVDNYVILDDDSDMLLWQKDNFVQTDTYKGINEQDVQKAISILNKAYENKNSLSDN